MNVVLKGICSMRRTVVTCIALLRASTVTSSSEGTRNGRAPRTTSTAI